MSLLYHHFSEPHGRYDHKPDWALPRTTALMISLSAVFLLGLALIVLGLR
jgi:hypothetical protein